MKPITIISVFSLLLGLLSACFKETENCHYTITVNNNSSKDIYIYGDIWYPDTVIHLARPDFEISEYEIVKSKSINKDVLWDSDCLEYTFKYNKKDTLSFFIFDANVIKTEKWDSICYHYKILKRLDLSNADLTKSNWIINYP